MKKCSRFANDLYRAFALLVVLLLLIFSACSCADTSEPITLKDISVSDDSETVSFTVVNNTDEQWNYGTDYKVEKYVDNQWKELSFKPNIVFTSVSKIFPANSSEIIEHTLTSLSEPISAGKYRITKDFSDSEHKNTVSKSIEFTIE